MTNLRKTNKQTNKQIKHEFNMTKWQTLCLIFTSVYFSRNFITCRFFTPLSLFYWLTSNFLPTSIYTSVKQNWNTFTLFNMVDPKMRMVSIPFLIINDVIMTSILLLRFIYVLANLLNLREFRGKTTPTSSPYNFKKIFYKWFIRVIIGQTMS